MDGRIIQSITVKEVITVDNMVSYQDQNGGRSWSAVWLTRSVVWLTMVSSVINLVSGAVNHGQEYG